MELCNEHIGSWSSVRTFQQAVNKLGRRKYPLLSSVKPFDNSGYVDAEYSFDILKELNNFKKEITNIENIYLINKTSNEKLYHYIEVYNGEFSYNKDMNKIMGVDNNGFFIKKYDSKLELFRAVSFKQKISYKRKSLFSKEKKIIYEIIDNSTNKKVELTSSIIPDYKNTEFEVIKIKEKIEDYSSFEPLKRIFTASFETGNPVIWC